MTRGVKTGGGKICRYEHDVWLGDDGRLFVKATAIEFERATETTFALSAKRRMRLELERYGLPTNWADGIGAVEIWDVARDWPSSLPEAVTYVTARPLPVALPRASAA